MANQQTEDAGEVPMEGSLVPTLGGENIIDIARRAKESAEAYKILRRHSLDICYGSDWNIQGQGEDPDPVLYLEGKGARRLAHAWGISWTDVKQEVLREADKHGEYITVITRGKVRFQGRENDEMGTCSTRDPFHGKADKQLLPLEDIDLNNVRKDSFTDFCRRAVTHMLGLEQVPLSELSENKQKGIKRIDRKRGGKGGATRSPEDTALANRIWNGCLHMAGGDEGAAVDLLKKFSGFKGNDGWVEVSSYEELQKKSGAYLSNIFERLEKEWKGSKNGNGGAP